MDKHTPTVRSNGIAGQPGRDLLKIILTTVAAMGIAGSFAPVYAEPICIAITADVVLVDDPNDFLDGAINVGDVIIGTYDYESTTPDTNPLSTVGDYRHTTAPFGITLDAEGFIFRTDSNNVDFLVEIVNDHGNPPRDNYLLRSYENIFDRSATLEMENHISWQLDDPTTNALSSEALPTVPPELADWQSLFGLTIGSTNVQFEGFFVRAHVTSAIFCSDDPTQEVAVCHKPGTPAQKTLYLPQDALDGHLRHGDALSECP